MPSRLLLVGAIVLMLAFAAALVAAAVVLHQPPLTPIPVATASRA